MVDASAGLNQYTVRSGDTLYSVAWRYGLNFQQVARANNIPSPYMIHPGQRLLITNDTVVTKAPTRAPTKPPQAVVVKSKSVPAKPPVKNTPMPNNASESWRWPADGKPGTRYTNSGKVHKGVDINGELGQAVKVAKSGKVVYAGNGLKAYGLLVIVKHDEHYLSAYAYNRKVLVKEGDTVTAGQQIAAMGQRDDGAVLLHFEIRRDGKPQDPMRYLPKR